MDTFEDIPTAVLETLGSLVARPPLAVELDTPLAEVSRLLLQHRVPAIAVVDGDHLKGLVTRSDVLRVHDESSATASDAMTNYVFALPARSSIEKAAALMAYECVGQVCVTGDSGELLGMVSALDVARHYAIESGYLAE
ncbi:MAG: CBS domain-containing protein [Kofleriaceae bacterium]